MTSSNIHSGPAPSALPTLSTLLLFTLGAVNEAAWEGFRFTSIFRDEYFKDFCLLLIFGLVFIFSALRTKRIIQKLEMDYTTRLVERDKVSRELHDSLLQNVEGLILRVHTATNLISVDDPVRQMLEETLRMSDVVMLDNWERFVESRTSSAGISADTVSSEELRSRHEP